MPAEERGSHEKRQDEKRGNVKQTINLCLMQRNQQNPEQATEIIISDT